MKTNKLLLLSIILFSTIMTKAQSFTTDLDSVNATKQFILNPADDSTDVITLYNATANPLNLKVMLSYEDLGTTGVAFVEFTDAFQHQIVSNYGIGFTDSIVVAANDSVKFQGVMIVSGPLLMHKMQLTVYDPLDSVNSHQVLTFSEVNCGVPNGNIIVNPTGTYCSTDSVFYNAVNGFSSYQWSTGHTTQTIHVPAGNTIYIDAVDSLGCLSKDTADIDVTIPYDEEICIVSVDSVTGKNIVVWEKTPMQRTEQFYIYKESFQAGVYNLIGFVPYDSLSVFVDVNSNPLQQAERYKISTVDSCGTESLKSSDHKTIHLTASVGTSNENNLVWDGYDGFSFPTYNIWRGPTPNNMSILAQVASTAFTYSDLTPLVGNNYYKIEAVRTSTCNPTQKSSSYPSSISNSVTLNPLGIDDVSGREKVTIYPNPTQNNITITLEQNHKDILINVKNVLGSVIASNSYTATNKVQMEINKEAGIYFVEIVVDGNYLTTKQVIKR